LLASRVSAVEPVCRASAEFVKGFVEADFVEVVDELAELLVLDVEEELADEALDDELEELLDAGVGAVGWKKVLPAPNPILAALSPPTNMVAV
jgi:hypothetical protein